MTHTIFCHPEPTQEREGSAFSTPGEDDTEHQTQLRGKDNLDSSFVPHFGMTLSFCHSDERSEEESTSLNSTLRKIFFTKQ